jgi:DNA-binding transcriptional ArsR family regulator
MSRSTDEREAARSPGDTVLRIYFARDDFARTRLAGGPDPLWELGLSLQMLRPQRGDLAFTIWRRKARAAIDNARLGAVTELLLALTPNVGYFPDFLNPIEAAHGLDAGLEAIRGTPIPALDHDIGRLATTRRLPATARQLAAGNPQVLRKMTAAMRVCYDLTVAPYRRQVATAVARDRRRRLDAFARGGVEGLLTSLRPMMSWSPDELSVPSHRDQELHLGGRGLLLIPSYFCVSGPLTMFKASLPPVLVYPVERGPEDLPHPADTPAAALDALMGLTRAAVLEALHTGEMTTTELARTVGISAASASEHAKILRNAGLLISRRDRNRMLHHLSGLGLAFLEGQQGQQDGRSDPPEYVPRPNP